MRFAFIAFVVCFIPTAAIAIDVQAVLKDPPGQNVLAPVTGDNLTLLSTAIKAFYPAADLAKAQRFYCKRIVSGRLLDSEGADIGQKMTEACQLIESGTVSLAVYGQLWSTLGFAIRPISQDGANVTYERTWPPVEIGVTNRTQLLAFVAALHPTVTAKFILDLFVARTNSGIGSAVAYYSVLADTEIAPKQLDGSLVRQAADAEIPE